MRALAALLLLAPGSAAAAGGATALELLPRAELAALAPLARQGDLALIQSRRDGTMKQVTLLLFVAAPPETVHEVIAHPAEYPRFVPNMTRSSWSRRPDGTMAHGWRLELPVSSFEGENAYAFEAGAAGAILFWAAEPGSEASYRWEMVPVPGGTLLVQYGYTDVKHSNRFVRAFLRRQPVMEHGLALAAQLMMCEPMRAEAERRAPRSPPPPAAAAGRSSGFGVLLARGQVAVLRRGSGGRLGEVSIIDRIYAAEAEVLRVIAEVDRWAGFIPGVQRSDRRDGASSSYFLEMAVPLVSWSTLWAARREAHAVELAGLAGDLRGGRIRWDLESEGARRTLAIYRARQPLGQSHVILRKLFQRDPSLEYGINVAFGLVYARAIRGKAEGWR